MNTRDDWRQSGQLTTDLLQALGPLAPLYADPAITEILVDAPDRIWIERSAGLEEASVQFDSMEALGRTIDALIKVTGAQPAATDTIVGMRFPDGLARAVAVFPPTAREGLTLVIRRLIRSRVTWEELLEWGSVTRPLLDLIQNAIHAHVNLLIAGSTASGKTTVACRITELIPAVERVIVVENVHEMIIQHPRALFLEAGGPANVSMTDLITTASVMRPDWLVIGEMVGPEALRTVEIFSRGHSGLTTVHANSAEDALARLEAACLMANLGLGLGEIRNLIAAAIRLVLFQQYLPSERRKITQVVEVLGIENGRYLLQPLFRYDPDDQELKPTGARPSW